MLMKNAWRSALVAVVALIMTTFDLRADLFTFTASEYDNTANTVVAGPTPVNNQTTGSFRDVIWWSINNGLPRLGSPDYINQGFSLGVCGITACPGPGPYTALNFTGPAISGGQSYLTIYDTTPADGTTTKNTFDASVPGGITVSADILFSPGNHTNYGGVVELYNEGQDALALLAQSGGLSNPDGTQFKLIFQSTGSGITLGSQALANTSLLPLNWYRVILNVTNSGDSFTANGELYNHLIGTDPTSGLGSQITTISYTGSLANADPSARILTNPGEVGVTAYANNIENGCPPPYTTCTDNVGVSVTNFEAPTVVPEPASFLLVGPFLLGAGLLLKRRNRASK